MTDTLGASATATTTPTAAPSATTALSTAPAPVGPQPTRPGPLRAAIRLWRRLTSMRTALMLLSLLALAAIPGTVIPQRGLDPVKVDDYLARHPHLGPLLDHLSLFDVFAAPWFAAVYLLLFVSLIGCLVPRIRLHAAALRRRPPNAPRHLHRLPVSTGWHSPDAPQEIAAKVRDTLRRSHWRADLRTEADGAVTVCAEKGYLRETGNLIFHVSLVVLLVGIALGGLYGYKGTVLVSEGHSFSDVRASYDVFQPSRLFSDSQLPAFGFTLDKFTANYQANGEPTHFDAAIHYQSSPNGAVKPYDVSVNHPLSVDGARVFLVGHGYALHIKVRDKSGNIVYDDETPFLPDGSTFASHGVVKVPDLQPKQLGLLGFFYPTYAIGADGSATSAYPGPTDPVLSLLALSGNLGIDRGAPQSVYSLPITKQLSQIGQRQLTPGESWKLPNGATVDFVGVDQWATFQVAHEPGKTILLIAAIGVIAGLLASLRVRRRRFWLRAYQPAAVPRVATDIDRRTVVTAAGLARSDADGFADELHDLVGRLGPPPPVADEKG